MPAPDAQAHAAGPQAAAREDLCRLLAACYYEPGPEFGEERVFDQMLAAAETLGAELADPVRRLRAAHAGVDALDLLVDYTRLFLGPPQALARPYASVWLTGESSLMQDETMQVLRLYEQGGMQIDGDFKELPDHVAVELEFLYLLVHQENQAVQANDAAALQALQALRTAFLDGHLGRWLNPFILAVQQGAQTAFYQVLAELTDVFVRLEARRAVATGEAIPPAVH
ncbi:MAG: molecular chaperone TorD family protein [Rubrivivax sp.]|nr:molecular chaperone TorD family protein [Rubrivivax sp.]